MSFDKYKSYTQARVGLGNKGAGLPTKDWLAFSYSHAAAVDAVRVPWDMSQDESGIKALGIKTERLTSAIHNREDYLLRPDQGRKLSEDSSKQLTEATPDSLLIIVTNGLSSFAVTEHATKFIGELYPMLRSAGITLAHEKIYLIPEARVGIVDDIGEVLKPAMSLIIVGERPGLSSPDSLGLYLTYRPRKGLSDADRNCISNVRPPHGLTYAQAAFKAMFLIQESIRRKISGVQLKDEAGDLLK